jgi:hypothetical protein
MFYVEYSNIFMLEYYHKIRGFKYDVKKIPHPIYLLLHYLVNMDEKDF